MTRPRLQPSDLRSLKEEYLLLPQILQTFFIASCFFESLGYEFFFSTCSNVSSAVRQEYCLFFSLKSLLHFLPIYTSIELLWDASLGAASCLMQIHHSALFHTYNLCIILS